MRLPSVEIDSFIPIGTTKNGRNANHDLGITPNPLRTLQPTKLTTLPLCNLQTETAQSTQLLLNVLNFRSRSRAIQFSAVSIICSTMIASKAGAEKEKKKAQGHAADGAPPPPPPRPGLPPHQASRTYISQSALPRLPIPSLEETLERFQRAVHAIQTPEEREQTKADVEEFLASGDGPKLQAMLVAYDEEGERDGTLGSYIEEFWSDAYLAPDTSVVPETCRETALEPGQA